MSQQRPGQGFGRPQSEWEATYQGAVEEMPWFYEALDPDVEHALERLGIERGRFLDIGAGPGTQVIAMAGRGFDATGTDLSQTAVTKAQARAASKGVNATVVVDDILASKLEGAYDVVLDRGCFHVIPPEQRGTYVSAVHKLVTPGARPGKAHLFIKTFSSKQPGERGPYRFTPEMLRSLFADRFDILSIDESVYQGTLKPLPLALFAVMTPR